ncbi:MAG: sensor histidine kinase [Anaerolineae bacterium]|nr:sensor histidine kinase [Anaerolineae bacterium]
MKLSVTAERYLYTTLAVVISVILVLALIGLLYERSTVGALISGVCVLAVVGCIVRIFDAPARSRERETAALHAGLRAQMDATTAQQERNRLARDLHDSIKQQLFSIQMSAAAAQARWESDPDGARQAVADVRVNAHEALAEMNAMLQQLSPAPLEKVGLVQALRDQGEALGYRSGAEVAVTIGDLPDDADFPPGAQEALFRIAQEALSNVARHARAQHVTLDLSQPQAGGPVTLEIHDDGQGFDAGAATNGMGLNNIRQRVESLGGKLEIQSTPGAGATLRVAIGLTPAPAPSSPLINQTIQAGFVGGLALIAALFYPLYTLAPQGRVPGWPTGSPVLGALCALIAAGLAVGVGYVAVRRSGGVSQSGALAYGALAGCTAGLIAYLGIGALAANLSALEWLQEPYPAWMNEIMATHYYYPEDVPFEYAMASISIQTIGALWIALLSGAGLGSLGGWLASRRMHHPVAMPSLSRQWFTLLAMSGVCNGLMLIVYIGTYTSISAEYILNEATIQPYPEVFYNAIVLPISTLLLFYLASAGGLYGILRAGIRRGAHAALGSAQIAVVIFGSASVGFAFWGTLHLSRILVTPVPLRILPGTLLLACAGLGVLYWLLLREIRPRWRALGLGPLQVPRILAWMVLPFTMLVLFNNFLRAGLTVFLLILAATILSIIIIRRNPSISLLGDSMHTTPWRGSDVIGAVGAGLLLAILLPLSPYLLNITGILTNAMITSADNPVATLQRAFSSHILIAIFILIAGFIAVGLSTLALDGIMALTRVGEEGRR